ncbi:MAG: hypothetical protein KAW12_28925 [Candidatus Aminicenantes bacterium]|nr:hypothetical protein [Candidatus Aminicenantes bacterium]
MKRGLLALFLVILFMAPVHMAGFSISITGNYLSPADENFKTYYGNSIIFPELKLRHKIFAGISLWAGYATFSAAGTTGPVLQVETKSIQSYISFGLGYNGNLSPKLGYIIEVGGVSFKYKEEAMGEAVSDTAFGFRADLALTYKIVGPLFVELTVGYLSGSDTINGIDIKLGGMKAGAGLGVGF